MKRKKIIINENSKMKDRKRIILNNLAEILFYLIKILFLFILRID
jgi:hypothetical protein